MNILCRFLFCSSFVLALSNSLASSNVWTFDCNSEGWTGVRMAVHQEFRGPDYSNGRLVGGFLSNPPTDYCAFALANSGVDANANKYIIVSMNIHGLEVPAFYPAHFVAWDANNQVKVWRSFSFGYQDTRILLDLSNEGGWKGVMGRIELRLPTSYPQYPALFPFDQAEFEIDWIAASHDPALSQMAQDVTASCGPRSVVDVISMNEDQAIEFLEQEGFAVFVRRWTTDEYTEGTVIDQEPRSGVQRPAGSPVMLTVAQSSQCFRVREFEFQAQQKFAEPWRDVDFYAEFTGPGDTTFTINGFWDGGFFWKIRFAPPSPGAWSYRTFCPQDAGLHGRSGSFSVAAASGENPLFRNGGFLKVSDNKRYLTYSDGTPFFWLADTWWFGTSDYMPMDGSSNPSIPSCFRYCVRKRKSQRFSVVHFGFVGFLKGYLNPDYFYSSPQIQPAYWQEVDRHFDYITHQGILPVVGLQWRVENTLEQWKIIWKYFIARYGAYPMTWNFNIEYNADSKLPLGNVRLTKLLGQYIKDLDPYKRAMTVMPWVTHLDGHEVWDDPWHDFITLQGGHNGPTYPPGTPFIGPPLSMYRQAYHHEPQKPVMLQEVTFEGIQPKGILRPHDDTVVRYNAYNTLQCGFCGFGYGAQGLWYPTQNDDDHTFDGDWGESIPWWRALERPGGYQMTTLRRFYESIEWWTLAPYDAVNQTSIPVLSKDDKFFALYYSGGHSILDTVRLSRLPANHDYLYEWFDPRAGEKISYQNSRLSVDDGQLVLPVPPDQQDWILVLQDASTTRSPAASSVNGPAAFKLHQNYPNPFNSSTEVTYDMVSPCFVQIQVINSKGQIIELLTESFQPAGTHRIVWKIRSGHSGLYFIKMKAGDHSEFIKCLVLR